MIGDKINLGKPKIELRLAAERDLATSLRRVVRPPSTAILEETWRQSLQWAEARRIQQLRAMIPKTELAAIKIADEADRITKTYARSKAMLETVSVAKHVEAIAAAESFRNRVELIKQPLTILTAWQEQQDLWSKRQALLTGFSPIGMPYIIGVFPDSEPVAIIREIVYALRDDKADGDELEETVADKLPDALRREFGIKVSKICRNQPLHHGDENGEIDLVVECKGGLIFLVEVKKTIDNKKISRFINKNARIFIESKDALSARKIHGVIAYVNRRDGAISFAKERGLLIYKISEYSLELVNPLNTPRLCDLRLVSFANPKTQQTPHKCRKKKLDKQDTPHEWIHYKNSERIAPSFKVRSRPTRSCRNYLKNFLDMYDYHRLLCNSSATAEAIVGDYIVPSEKFITDALRGWENVIGSDGAIIPFSAENATQLFKDYPILYENLVRQIYRIWRNNLTDKAVP